MLFTSKSVAIGKEEYDEYIRRHSPKQLDKIIDALDDEDTIIGFTIMLPTGYNNTYDELWVIDAGEENIPILIKDINTSSCMALWSCGIYNDDDDDETHMDLEELIDCVGKGWRRSLKKVFEENYTKEKKKCSVEEIIDSLKDWAC